MEGYGKRCWGMVCARLESVDMGMEPEVESVVRTQLTVHLGGTYSLTR